MNRHERRKFTAQVKRVQRQHNKRATEAVKRSADKLAAAVAKAEAAAPTFIRLPTLADAGDLMMIDSLPPALENS